MIGSNTPAKAADRARRNTALQLFGRIGSVCHGIVHLVIAWLAVQVAVGGNDDQADQDGAVQVIVAGPFGRVLVGALAVGLIAFGLWQLSSSATGFRWAAGSTERTRRRIAAAGRGVAGLALAGVAIRALLGSGQSGDQSQQELTEGLLALPAGQILVAVLAAIVLAVGVASVANGVTRRFLAELDIGPLPQGSARWVRRVGTLGHVAKGVAVGVVGFLIGLAALTRDPEQAGGLDAALRTLASSPFGATLLLAVAAGFAAYGVFAVVQARCLRS
ncbi:MULTISPECIES: DUF1206 domain-containing protein [Actinoalloteichus]|uniref:DUF1206 family protein n=1 Tax=Actinoalloteichus fjordicus TaxID=1612552 RepID=A0AAC9LI29_9PSEU|nr:MULTISPECIES: DUF1206 domain-containing protein [Actinoalloteichus]APU16724.1 putative DUF1206 family protein [Actinoalloteichus fjordicus]APU22790.1 putative DUF1206 family protein [Actinoalloteichus sp. GBA129-24]